MESHHTLHLQEPAFTVSDMTSPDSGHDPDLDLKVGRWGERLVFHSLLEDAEATGSDVLWINQDENRTQPYDIIVTKRWVTWLTELPAYVYASSLAIHSQLRPHHHCCPH